MTDDEKWTVVGEVYPSRGDEVAMGVTITGDMIAAGAEAVRRLASAGASPEAIAEEVYFQMRQVTGEGRVQRRVNERRKEIAGGARLAGDRFKL